MVRPLGLTAYLALNGASSGRKDQAWSARPEGQLVLAFDPGGGHRSAFRTIAAQLRDERGDATLLICGPEGDFDLPDETLADAQAFISHWRPDAVLWADGPLRPALIHELAKTRAPMTLVNLSRETIETRFAKWPLGLRKSTIGLFQQVLCRDQTTLNAVARLGIPNLLASAEGTLSNSPMASPCDHGVLDILRAKLANRPIWLSLDTPDDMLDQLEGIHRELSGVSHRLILLVHPQDPDQGEMILNALRAKGWDAALLSQPESITSQTQVILSDGAHQVSLLLHLCSLAVMASTFDNSEVNVSPYEAALLGSAIVHGPNLGAMRSDYGPLMAGKATRSLRAVSELKDAVSDLLAPDQSAALAHVAWDISTRGAPLIEHLIEMLNAQLDEVELA